VPTLPFRRQQRIAAAADFRAAFDAHLAKPAGPITIHARPTNLPQHRLGLSIGRRFGPAHRRTALKRRLREAFRHAAPSLPRPPGASAYDLVITARTHPPLTPHQYATLIQAAVASIQRTLARRADHA
jgi:ribonuclease P protein component